ncbi:unnamed protein product [Oikopleura dioica]|uniref:PDZ domain-containing protein n=1 Tax=Oikopleura dioica TaxID=34765 RepID=E4Z1Y2_OIKDI|nr:unnamed protein product [Oikopleura dioica]
MSGSAAARVDLRYRDTILSVNDEPVEDKSHEKIVQMMQQSGFLRLQVKRLLSWQTTIEKAEERGFGFGVRGGADFELPLYILRLYENEDKTRFRGIRVGDVLLAVNSINIANFTHQQAVDLIKKSYQTLQLRLRRGNGTVPALSRGFSR